MPRVEFHRRIVESLGEIVEMIALVERAVTQATEAVLAGDVALATRVIAQDDAIDELYHRLEQRMHELFARQSPVAGDLRALMAIVRIIGDLERSGDLALNVARSVRRIAPVQLPVGVADLVARMSAQAGMLLRGAAHAVRDLEPETAERLDLMDDLMDELCRSMLDRLADPATGVEIRVAMELALVTRHYERIADHAVSVAERVAFVVTGTSRAAHVGL